MHRVYAHVLAHKYIFFLLAADYPPFAYYCDPALVHILVAVVKARLEQRRSAKGEGGKKDPKTKEIGKDVRKVYPTVSRVSVRATTVRARCIIYSAATRKKARDADSSWIYRGNIEMRDTGEPGVPPREGERDRGHLSLSPYVNVHPSHSPPHSPTHARSAARARRQKADHRSRFTSRYILFEVSTVLSLALTPSPPARTRRLSLRYSKLVTILRVREGDLTTKWLQVEVLIRQRIVVVRRIGILSRIILE